jgi:Flp pilus assembly protein TadG
MKRAFENNGQRGGAGVKLVIVLVIMFLIGFATYNYISVAYEAEGLKADMSAAVLQGLALPGNVDPVSNVKTRIQNAMHNHNAPADATLDVKMANKSINARVTYVKKVPLLPLGIYTHTYVFDNTATPTGFLMKE